MVLKDWILLLVPIFFNGTILFVLQKIFEKKQISRTIKFEYASLLRQKIDVSLELHAKATRLTNEINPNNENIILETVQQYTGSVLDVYYYYVPNKLIFKSLDSQMQELSDLVFKLTQCSHQKNIDYIRFSKLFNNIRDVLLLIKDRCIKLQI